jgi:uncharacterized protein Yka (UPF0111/DUF47 family)
VSLFEWEADKMQYKLGQQLFELESQVSPVDIMMWFEIFKMIGNLANTSEAMAKQLRTFFIAR